MFWDGPSGYSGTHRLDEVETRGMEMVGAAPALKGASLEGGLLELNGALLEREESPTTEVFI